MASSTEQTDNTEEQEQLDARAKYVLGLAQQNLSIVIDQVESIDGKDYKTILKALDTARDEIAREIT